MMTLARLFAFLFILIIQTILLKRDADKLFLKPLKEMYQAIKEIKQDPVEAVEKAKEKGFIKEVLMLKKPLLRLVEQEKQSYETTMLQNKLIKSS
jgi:hypothetical protein